MAAKTLQGVVTSEKMNKTVTVMVGRRTKHPKYGKYISLSTKYHVHDEKEVCNEGDTVLIQECKPCLLYTSPSPRDATLSRMPSSA